MYINKCIKKYDWQISSYFFAILIAILFCDFFNQCTKSNHKHLQQNALSQKHFKKKRIKSSTIINLTKNVCIIENKLQFQFSIFF